MERWLAAPSPRARFYEGISRQTRAWAGERRGAHWHSADGLAMAYALEPDGSLEEQARPLSVEQEGRSDHVRILMRYEQARFEGLIQAALAAG